jgi:putative transcriptional regulator
LLQYQKIKPGDIIVSSPHVDHGQIFSKSVIFIMSHDKTGTSGVICNKLLSKLDGKEILNSLQISKADKLPKEMKDKVKKSASLPVYFGGPVEQEKGIILHSSDYPSGSLMRITPKISASTNSEIVTDIVLGKGPKHKTLVLGYASWRANQLMEEIQRNDWLLLLQNDEYETDAAFNLLFIEDHLYRWKKALELAGVELPGYINHIGNA